MLVLLSLLGDVMNVAMEVTVDTDKTVRVAVGRAAGWLEFYRSCTSS